MFDRILGFFRASSRPAGARFAADDPRLAFVGLCAQVMAADGEVSARELEKIRDLARRRFGLDDAALAALVQAGQDASREAIDYYRFTSVLKQHLPEEKDRVELVATLWDLVHADGRRTEIEDHVIWRIADLLDVSSEKLQSARNAFANEGQPG